MKTKPTGMPEIDGVGYEITLSMHTDDAQSVLTCPERLRNLIGQKLDSKGLQEEIDYTLEVERTYKTRYDILRERNAIAEELKAAQDEIITLKAKVEYLEWRY